MEIGRIGFHCDFHLHQKFLFLRKLGQGQKAAVFTDFYEIAKGKPKMVHFEKKSVFWRDKLPDLVIK